LSSKLSNDSWLGDQDDEDDPFAQLEEGFDEMDLEANIARDKYARLRNQVEGQVSSLKTSQDDDGIAKNILSDFPETKSIILSAHGMLSILSILETCRRRDVIFNLLKLVNAIIFNDYEVQQNLCFVGGIPIINEFISKKYPEKSDWKRPRSLSRCIASTLTLQMFVSAGGLNVLVDFLEDDYIWSMFKYR
jgi:hypothetical protein